MFLVPTLLFASLSHAGSHQGPVIPEEPTAVFAEPNPALPGQAITIHWPEYFGPVSIKGGSLREQKLGGGKTWIRDRPARTATYTIEKRAARRSGSPPKAIVTVHVYPGVFPRLATYTDTRNWSIDVVAGWNRYVTDFPDPANNALFYFQPEEDSVERLAVAIVPADGMDAAQLMRKVETDIPTQYDMLTRTERKSTRQGGMAAAWITFSGTEISHPDTPTKSMVLAFVKGPRGYIVSARTAANRYADREKLLRCLVRSFVFSEPESRGKRPVGGPAGPR